MTALVWMSRSQYTSVGRRRAACLSSVDAPQIFSIGVPGMLGELGTDWLVGVTGISILGFFTPLPLGCSSESCRFLGLFSTGGVSTKVESWGSGVAFSPKGSDYRRETSRNVNRAVVLSDFHAFPPCTDSRKPEVWNVIKNPAWAPPLPATSNCSQG